MFIRASSRIASPDESGYESIVWRVSPTTPPFTDKQGQYLAFIYAYSRIFRQPPAEADMQRHFQVSPPSVYQMVLTLERAALIRRTPGVARSIEILVEPEDLSVLAQGNRGEGFRWRLGWRGSHRPMRRPFADLAGIAFQAVVSA